jgi:threonine 3-dehydrogenase
MLALVKKHAREGLWLDEQPVPGYGINDVLIKVMETSICGTDVHIYNWDEWARKTIPVPMIIGHEFVGRIEAVGSNVHDCAIGDVVSAEGHVVCGRCRNCLAGRRHLCNRTSGIGVNRTGAFAAYVTVPVTNVWHCDPDIPLDVLSCFDPLGNATHTALAFDVLGEDVLITGAGPIGIMAAAIVKHAGARHVVITDVNDYRLELARKMGVTLAVNVLRDSIPDVVKQLGMKEAFSDMIDVMCHGGKIAILGLIPANACIDWNKVIFNGITLKGIYGREMYETWYKMTSMIQTGLDISPVITHKYPFTEFQAGFDAMRSGNSGKVILTWEDCI